MFLSFQLLNDNPKGQKYFLNGLEQLIALHAKSLVPKVPSILKAVYDLDLIDEDVILTWAAKVSCYYLFISSINHYFLRGFNISE